MKNKYPINIYTITYSYQDKLFSLRDKDDVLVATGLNGRELGRDAWDEDAHEVVYRYDLGIDENIPMRPRHEIYKA